MQSKKISFFNKLSFLSLLSTVFLSIFFFIPFIPVTLEASKGFLISIGIILSVLFWLMARLFEGKFSIPKDRLILYAFLIPIIFLISSFFSSSSYVSLFGAGFEIGTFGSMLILFFVLFLSSIYFQTEKRVSYFFMTLLGGALVLGIFEILYIFLGFQNLFPALLKGVSSGNLLGSWNDFSLFFGLIIILSLFTIEFMTIKKLFKYILYFLIVIGVIFLIIINAPLIWLFVGLFSLLVFVYNVSLQQTKNNKEGEHISSENKISITPLVIVFISLIFLIGNNFLGPLVSRYVSVNNSDVRPSISATYNVAIKAIKHNPLLGTGPNTFSIDWAQWKPALVTQTTFWNNDFSNGVGLIPTFLVTTGILGFLACLWFLVVFVMRGVQSTRLVFKNTSSNYFIMASFIISLYAWITTIVFVPNIIMLMIAFASTGAFIGILSSKKDSSIYSFSFLDDPRNSFFSILIIVALMIAAISTAYIYVEKFTSIIYFSRSLNPEANIQSLIKSEKMLNNAITLDKNDIYYRTLSQVYIAEINTLIADKTLSQDTLKSSIQTLIDNVGQVASLAVSQNPKQYINWVNLGDVYSALVPLNVSGSYENAMQAYTKAIALAPMNPSIILSQAQLELNHKNNDAAKKFVDQALVLKGNYIDAIFMRAQIKLNEGNPLEAIKQGELAASIAPNDPTVFFQLGILRYNNSNYSDAVSAFETAVILNPNYLRARYFLGLAYQKSGRTQDAITQFKILNQILPNNKEVIDNLNSLVAGNGLVTSGATTSVPVLDTATDKTDTTTTKSTTTKKTTLPQKP